MKQYFLKAILAAASGIAPLVSAKDPEPTYIHITNVTIFNGVNEETRKRTSRHEKGLALCHGLVLG